MLAKPRQRKAEDHEVWRKMVRAVGAAVMIYKIFIALLLLGILARVEHISSTFDKLLEQATTNKVTGE
jgi:hypothetical protein